MAGDDAIFPIVNGRNYDYSSVTVNAGGDDYKGVQSIDYGNALDPGEARGSSPIAFGTTTGVLKPDASMEMHKATYDAFVQELGDGYMTKVFLITVTYAQDGMPTIVDELLGCRIKKDRDSPKA